MGFGIEIKFNYSIFSLRIFERNSTHIYYIQLYIVTRMVVHYIVYIFI